MRSSQQSHLERSPQTKSYMASSSTFIFTNLSDLSSSVARYIIQLTLLFLFPVQASTSSTIPHLETSPS